jgi:Fic family protein
MKLYIAGYCRLWHNINNMLSFQIDNKLTQDLIDLQSTLSKKVLELQYLDSKELSAIHQYAKISQIGASTRIENAILTDSEIDLIDRILGEDPKTTAFHKERARIKSKLNKDIERSLDEVVGCRKMLNIIYQLGKEEFPLTEVFIRELHKELMKFYGKAKQPIGDYKKNINSVVEINHMTGEKIIIFKTADPGLETIIAMRELVDWYNKALKNEPWALAVTSEFVLRFLAIHPFQDGNGRLGRGLWLLSMLHSSNEQISKIAPYVAIDRYIEKHKEDYYLVLQECSKGEFKADSTNYNIQYFLRFMINILHEALKGIDVYRKRYKDYYLLSDSAIKVLNTFRDKPEIKLQTRDVCKLANLPERTVRYALLTLCKKQFIQRYGQGASTKYQLIF